MTARRTLVTGASGFIGANLARRLLRRGDEVHLLLRPEHATWRLDGLRPDVRPHVADLLDAEAVASVVTAVRPDWIFHLAVYGAYSYQTGLRAMLNTNVIGTANLLEACLRTGFESLVNTGSSSEYGLKNHAPVETEGLEPNSHYAVTKASATLLCRYAAKSNNLHIPTLRLYSIYGPWEEPGRLVPSLVTHALAGQLPPLASPSVARDFVYVDDAVDAYLLAASASPSDPGAIYNVASGVQTTLAELVAVARRVFGVSEEPRWSSMPNRAWDTTTWVGDNSRLRTEVGWNPVVSLESGLSEMGRWLREQPEVRRLYANATADHRRNAA